MLKKRNLRIILILGMIFIILCPTVLGQVNFSTEMEEQQDIKLKTSEAESDESDESDNPPPNQDPCQTLKDFLESLQPEAKSWSFDKWLDYFTNYYNITEELYAELDINIKNTFNSYAEAMVDYYRDTITLSEIVELFSGSHNSGYIYSAYNWLTFPAITPKFQRGLHEADIIQNNEHIFEVKLLARAINYDLLFDNEEMTQIHVFIRKNILPTHADDDYDNHDGVVHVGGSFNMPGTPSETTSSTAEPLLTREGWIRMDIKGLWPGQVYSESWKGVGDEMIMQAKIDKPTIKGLHSYQIELLFQCVYRYKNWWEGFYRYRITNNYIFKVFRPVSWGVYSYHDIRILDDDINAPLCAYSNAKIFEPFVLFGDVPFQHDTIWYDYFFQNEPVQAMIEYGFINFKGQVITPWEERGFTWINLFGQRAFSCHIPTGPDTYGYHYLRYTVFDNDQDEDPDGITNPLLTSSQISSLSGDRASLIHTFVVAKYRTDITIDVSIVPAIWDGVQVPEGTPRRYVEKTGVTDPYTFKYGEPFLVKVDITYPSHLNILIYDLWLEIDSPSLKTSLGLRHNLKGTFQLDGTGSGGEDLTTTKLFTKWAGFDPPNIAYKLTTEFYDEGVGEPEQEFDELKIWNWFEDGEWGIDNIPLSDYDTSDTFEIQAFAKYSYNISQGWSDPYDVSNDYVDYPVRYLFEVHEFKVSCIDIIQDEIKRKWEENSIWDALLTGIGIAVSTIVGVVVGAFSGPGGVAAGVATDVIWELVTGAILGADKNELKRAFSVLKSTARCPLDFDYDLVYEPVFNYSIILEIPDYPDSDQILLDLYKENLRNQIELTEYYNALYVTFNRLTTAQIYAPEFLILQQERYANFRTKIIQLENEIFEVQQEIFGRMEILNPEYNLIDLFQDFTAYDVLNLLINYRNKINESTLDPDLKEHYYNQYDDLILTYPQNNLDDTLYDMIIKDESPESLSLPLDTEYLSVMNYPENDDLPTIENLDYAKIASYDTETTISFFTSDADGISDIQLFGANVVETTIDYNELTQKASISLKLLKYGENELTLVVTDNHPYINRSTFQKLIIFVDDGEAPQISLLEKTFDPIYDSTMNSNYSFLITDLTLTNVIIKQNDLEIFNGMKHLLTVDLPNSSGIYEYEIFVTDALGNTNETTFTVEILDDDTTPPTVEFNPIGDLTDGDVYELSNQIEVIVSDPLGGTDIISSGISSIIYTIDSGPMISLAVSDSPLQYSFFIDVPNILGEHNIIIEVFDSDNESEYDQQGVTVEHVFSITDDDEEPPEILSIVTPLEVGVTNPTFNVELECYDYSGIFMIDCYVKLLDGSDEIYHIFTDLDIPEGTNIFQSYIIPMETPEYSLYEKEFEVIFIATDNDNDRLDDELVSDPISVVVLSDDDLTSPLFTIEAINCISDGELGVWRIVAEDESGLFEIGLKIDGIDMIFTQVDFGTGTIIEILIPINNELGEHSCEGYAIDSDLDRGSIDQLETVHPPVFCFITDDDIDPPIIPEEFFTISDTIHEIYISLKAIDESGIKEVIITIDDEFTVIFNELSGEFFTFIVDNYWNMDFGTHNVEIEVWDADEDRMDDSMFSIITGTFETSLEETKQYVIWRIDQLIQAIQDSSDDSWQKKNDKATMINKLTTLKQMISENNFEGAYDKLLHDIKPKLTGLKTDENEEPWGNGVFKNPWVTSSELQEIFRVICNEISTDITVLIQTISTMEYTGLNYFNAYNSIVLNVNGMGGIYGYNIFLLIGLISIIPLFSYFRRKKK